jgi:hypothetical protein
MIGRNELLVWLNAGTFSTTISRVDALADLLTLGLVSIDSDGDAITALRATAAGREQLLILPATVS